MRRRDFAKSTFLGVAMAAAMPFPSRAESADPYKNVVFTEGDPGHWEKVEKLHIPETTVAGGRLTIKTPHPMRRGALHCQPHRGAGRRDVSQPQNLHL